MSLQDFKTVVETAFQAATPSPVDGSSSVYAFIDDFTEERGNGRHRELLWRLATKAEVIAQHELQHQWNLPLELYLHRRDRTYRAFTQAVEQESVTLAALYSTLTALGTDVWEAELQGFTTFEKAGDKPTRGGGIPMALVVTVTYNFRVLTGE